eukprot:CAMPEP_0202949198 /NCGR_PEP_ID=MMETSP1395-20130829/15152_1 /ASSEMBLY_ACC=CAM_ASM_000871 /TAXON_ID=5961 /ORGANISM="Blepharisma japonicum, Strain Stock R1072" /LENGTH=44 /DNA_ID= /DNA_START= /DNA_END= /DNA_ORIENTATION=
MDVLELVIPLSNVIYVPEELDNGFRWGMDLSDSFYNWPIIMRTG